MEINPWRERFAPLCREEIAKRMTCIPNSYEPAPDTHTGLVSESLRQSLEALFLPTEQLLDVAEFVIGMANAHSHIHYHGTKTFLEDCYQEKVPLREHVPAIGITGLAGVGKTAFANAIHRCLSDEVQVALPNHEPKILKMCWMLTMPSRMTPAAVMKAYLEQDGAHGFMDKTIPLATRCRRQAFQRGVSLMSMDETQFGSFNSSSNAAITSILISICRMGIPSVFYLNYSLAHSLWARPQQDRQRLLSRHFTLLPDAADSSDWRNFLTAVCDIAPTLLDIDVERDAEFIHFRTAGIKRLVVDLLQLAVEACWSKNTPVNTAALEVAFKSPQYGANREDVEILYEQLQTKKQAKRGRRDLWSPYPIEETRFSNLARTVIKMKEQGRLQKLIEYSTTPAEKEVLKDMRKGAAASDSKPGSNVTSIRKRRNLEALTEADEEFRKK